MTQRISEPAASRGHGGRWAVGAGIAAALLTGASAALEAFGVRGWPMAALAAAVALCASAVLWLQHRAHRRTVDATTGSDRRALYTEIDGRFAAFAEEIDAWQRREGYRYAGALHPFSGGRKASLPEFRELTTEMLLTRLALDGGRDDDVRARELQSIFRQIRELGREAQEAPMSHRPPLAGRARRLVAEARRVTASGRPS